MLQKGQVCWTKKLQILKRSNCTQLFCISAWGLSQGLCRAAILVWCAQANFELYFEIGREVKKKEVLKKAY